MDATIRYMETLDLPLALEGYSRVTLSPQREESAKRFVRWLAETTFAGTTLCLVAIVDDLAVGLTVASLFNHAYDLPERQAFSDLSYIKKKYRGHKIASQLGAALVSELRILGYTFIQGASAVKNHDMWTTGFKDTQIKQIGYIYQANFKKDGE